METKERIMQVTFELLLSSGFDAISVSQITKRAGITKGALYYFFENKEDLFEQVVEHYFMNFMNQLVNSRIKETSSIKEQVRLFYEIKTGDTDHSSTHKNVYRLLQDGIDKYEKLREQFKKFNDSTIEYQVNVLEEGKAQGVIRPELDSRLLALNNMTWGRGMLLFDESNRVENTKEMADAYFDLIWRSIAVSV